MPLKRQGSQRIKSLFIRTLVNATKVMAVVGGEGARVLAAKATYDLQIISLKNLV